MSSSRRFFASLACALAVLFAFIGQPASATTVPVQPTDPSVQAMQTGEPVPIAAQTTSTTTVTAEPDGTYQANVAAGPVRELDPSSPTGWSPVDLTLQQRDSSIQPVLADAAITFSSGGMDPVATLSTQAESYGVGWDGSLPAPALSGSTATYSAVQQGVDLKLTALTDGYDMSFVVNSPPTGQLSFSLPISTSGLTASVSNGDQLVLSDDSGNVVAQSDPATVFGSTMDEATGEPVAQEPVAISVTGEPGSQSLQIVPMADFFSQGNVTYPVTVDPSPSLSVNVDTYVRDGSNAGNSYSTDTELKMGLDTNDSSKVRSLLNFSGVSAFVSTHIFSADLFLWETKAASSSCVASTMNVYGLTSAFSSSTTWNTKPSTGSLYASASTNAGGGTSCPAAQIDISGGGASGLTLVDLVQSWSNGSSNYGLELKASDETSTNSWKKFSSADAGSNVPYLLVNYDAYGDTSDNADGSSWWNDSNSTYGTYAAGSTPGWGPYGLQNEAFAKQSSYPYKTVGSLSLYAYEYDPPNPLTNVSYPAMILVHGGGWKVGSPNGVADIAHEFAIGSQSYIDTSGTVQTATLDKKFIVFAIDYRLDCTTSDSNVSGTPIASLCGWDWTDGQAALTDVEDAITWARDCHENSSCSAPWTQTGSHVNWNGKVVAVGASSGGNLVYEAGALATGDAVPDAVAGWSGPEEMQATQISGGWYGCDGPESGYPEGFSSGPNGCWRSTNVYLGCGNVAHYVSTCTAYPDASPIYHYDSAGSPPIFMANGGGPRSHIGTTSAPEFIGLQELVDMEGYLAGSTTKMACSVNIDRHATHLLGYGCGSDTSPTVLQQTDTFLDTYV